MIIVMRAVINVNNIISINMIVSIRTIFNAANRFFPMSRVQYQWVMMSGHGKYAT